MEPLRDGDPVGVGRYRLLGRLGAGGMGEVFLGRDAGGGLAAVKLAHARLAADPQFRARFTREVATARAIRASWTARVLDADAAAPLPWLATEYVPGMSVDQAVAQAGPFHEAALGALAVRLAGALAQLHAQGVVHRDLKPSNVLLAADGPRLIDFGIARAADATAITQSGMVLGAPGFMSPEQALGTEDVPASDVFSLAAMLAYVATGRGPFGEASHPVVLMRRIIDEEPDLTGVPDGLRPVLQRCMAKRSADRPTAAELADQLAGYASAGWPPPSIAALLAPPLPQPVSQRPISRRALLAGAGMLGILGAAGLGVAASTGRDETAPATPLPTARWRFTAPERINQLAVAGDALYVGAGSNLLVLDAGSGTQRWRYDAVVNGYGRAGDELSLSVGAGLIYASIGGHVVALDPATGRPLWAADWTRPPPYRSTVDVRVAAASDVVCAAADGLIAALDPATGQVRWQHPVRDRFDGAPRTEAGRCFVASGASIEALDAATGNRLWRYGNAEDNASQLEVSNGVIVTAGPGLGLVAVDAATGAVRWQVPPGDHGAGRRRLVISDGVVLVLGMDGLHALDLATGAQRWARPDPSAGLSTVERMPAATGGVVYVGSATGDRVHAIDLASGATRWEYPAGGQRGGVGQLAAQHDTAYLSGYLGNDVEAVRL